MIRPAIQTLLLVSLWLAWSIPASAQSSTWTVVTVKRSETGFVMETTPQGTEKKLLVFGKKNEFLQITCRYRPGKGGVSPSSDDFKVLDEKREQVGKQTFFLEGKGTVTMVFRGDWSTLDGLSLEGPGKRSRPLGKAKADPKK